MKQISEKIWNRDIKQNLDLSTKVVEKFKKTFYKYVDKTGDNTQLKELTLIKADEYGYGEAISYVTWRAILTTATATSNLIQKE